MVHIALTNTHSIEPLIETFVYKKVTLEKTSIFY
jgi:hypothetical protein